MVIKDKLSSENIDSEKLQKGLKHIGLNLSKFDGVEEEQVPYLIELFKIIVDIDPLTSTKFTRIDLRLKLEKILKGQRVKNHNNTTVDNEPSDIEVLVKDQIISNSQNSKFQRQPQLASINRKLGKVKFFDSTKGFGYLHSFDDNRDCFVHVSKLISSVIDDDDIVIFETVESKRKPGELDAIKVSNIIPVFIFNKESTSKSFVYPLLDNYLVLL